MCGAPHLRIHSSFRSAVFDSACQLRVSILFRLRRCRVPPWGRCTCVSSLVPVRTSVLLSTAPSRAARTQCIDSRPGDTCQQLIVKSTTRAYSEPERLRDRLHRTHRSPDADDGRRASPFRPPCPPPEFGRRLKPSTPIGRAPRTASERKESNPATRLSHQLVLRRPRPRPSGPDWSSMLLRLCCEADGDAYWYRRPRGARTTLPRSSARLITSTARWVHAPW